MGKGTNYMATNYEIATKIGYKGTISNPSYLCTNIRALNYGGYCPNYIKGKDNYCVKYNEDFFTCGSNTATNCSITVNSSITNAGLKVVATAVPTTGYDMASLTLQSTSGTTIWAVTSAPFTIAWTPDQNFKFTAIANAQTYEIYYTSSDGNIVTPYNTTVFGAEIIDNTYKNVGIITFKSAPTSVGDQAFYGCSTLTSIILQSSITSIGTEAFSECDNLASITMTDNITSIDIGAFNNCTSLTNVTIPTGVTDINDYTFTGCASLSSVTLHNSITNIGSYAFNACSSITSLAMPTSLTSIGDYAFSGTSITSISIPSTVTSIGINPFTNCDNLASISVNSGNTIYDSRNSCNAIIKKSGVSLISGCKNTTIPSGVLSIAQYAFYGHTGLASISIPSTVTSIGQSALQYCTGLTSITSLNTTPPSIGTNVFHNTDNCPIYVPSASLSSYQSQWSTYSTRIFAIGGQTVITYTSSTGAAILPTGTDPFGSNITIVSNTYSGGVGTWTLSGTASAINNNAFQNLTTLTSIQLSTDITSIGQYAFSGCTGLTSINLANTTAINSYAFQNSGLTSLSIPSSIITIGTGIISGCNSLTSISVDSNNTIYDSRENVNGIVQTYNNILIAACSQTNLFNTTTVTAIDGNAFDNLSGITSINIPDNITNIDEYALNNCQNLANIYVYSATPATIVYNTFYGLSSNLQIHIMVGSVVTYKTAWYQYQNIIV